MSANFSITLVTILASCSAPSLFAEDSFADLNNDPAVKEIRTKAAVQAAQLQLDTIQAQAAEAKLRAAVAQAELEASLVEQQSNVATKEKAIREALFGATVAPVEGTIEATSKAESYVIVSQQLDQMGRQVAAELRSRCSLKEGDRIFLLGGEPEATLGTRISSYKVVMARLISLISAVQTQKTKLNDFIQESRKRRPESIPWSGPMSAGEVAGLSGATLLQSGLSLAALFRTDREFTDVAMTFQNSALIAAVADHLIGYPAPEAIAGRPEVKTLPRLQVHSSTMTNNSSAMVSRYSFLHSEQIALNAAVTNLALHETLLKSDKANLTKRIDVLGKVVEAKESADTKAKEAEAAKMTADQKAKEAAEATEPADKEKKSKEAAIAKEAADKKAKEASDAMAAAERKAKDAETSLTELIDEINKVKGQLQTAENDLIDLPTHRANAARETAATEAELKQFASGTIDGSKAPDLIQAEYLSTALAGSGSYLVFLNINLASGTNLTHRNILTNSLRVGGGVSASYHALDNKCRTVSAGTVYGYSGFYKVPTTSRGHLPMSSEEPEYREQFPHEGNGQVNKPRKLGHPGRR